jgi:hypothetical protein
LIGVVRKVRLVVAAKMAVMEEMAKRVVMLRVAYSIAGVEEVGAVMAAMDRMAEMAGAEEWVARVAQSSYLH